MTQVLDASALLAFWLDEPGAEAVEAVVANGAAISTVSLSEVLARLVRDRPALADQLVAAAQVAGAPAPSGGPPPGEGLSLPGMLAVEPFTLADAVGAAALVPATRAAGLSFGDRACLALGRRLHGPVLTADRNWARLDARATGVEIRMLRPRPARRGRDGPAPAPTP